MSRDPERLLGASSGAAPLERELLDSVRHVGPPGGAKEEAWRALAAEIALVTAAGAATGSAAAAASKAGVGGLASWGLATKVAVVVVSGGVALGGGVLALHGQGASPSVGPRPVVVPQLVDSRPVAPVEVAQAPPPPLEEARAEDAPSRKVEPRRLDSLKAESALLMEARAQLRSGHAVAAQSALDKLQAQFPQGMLAQEREVLAIEVLHARGSVDAARRRASSFIKAHPKSPHSRKLARFVE
jgi:Outer membrane lipoprotein